MFATAKLCEFMTNPSATHLEALNRAIGYLYHTRNYVLEYSAAASPNFTGASDAAYADDTTTRKSSEWYVFRLVGGAIDWRATKQKTVTTVETRYKNIRYRNIRYIRI